MKAMNMATGAGFGALAMYFLDPQKGHARRAWMRDKFLHLSRQVRRNADITVRDLSNRSKGIVAEVKSRLEAGGADNDVLIARVRSDIGRLVSHPHALEVTAESGKVTLRGLALTEEIPGLLACVRKIKGVEHVDNQIEGHSKKDRIPSLQGGRESVGKPLDLFQNRWAPATKFLVGLTAGVLGAATIAGTSSLKSAQ